MPPRRRNKNDIEEGWHIVDHRHVAPWTQDLKVSEPQPRHASVATTAAEQETIISSFILRPVSSHLADGDDDWDTLETAVHYEYTEENGTEQEREKSEEVARDKKKRAFRCNQRARAKEQRAINLRDAELERAKAERRQRNKSWFESGGRSEADEDVATPRGGALSWALWIFRRP
ncbi:hypothetical protein BDV96DRAFT_642939 [Lophiotrema nucula]|uniref:Uncharacterized protein n=1 Tax=Lophiotrema nucula TaxID=690887 RepID=A0A6A5ZIU0_9PLEO|nr:hypothetical protein BDV96DRAFT_642939 [Lophiotrema nucula]